MLESPQDFFKGKKVTLMGLGLLGRGTGDAEYIAQQGAEVLVTDLKDEVILKNSVESLKKYPNIKFHLGGHDKADFINCDMVIKSAGVPLESDFIKASKDANIPVYMSTALFVYLSKIPVIGITGTRGKSTVTQMIYECLKAVGCCVHLGGNIRGLSTLSLLPQVKPGDVAVLELDSWQLQGFRDLKISPHISVFTNLMPDHMNYYQGDMDKYFYDKAGIFAHQKKEDFLVIGESIHSLIEKERPKSKIYIAPELPKDWKLSLPGEHNRQNVALALAAVNFKEPKVDEQVLKKVLEGFNGVEGRLSLVSEIKGVKFYNDSNATTPQATVAALNSFEKGKICLIAGGTDKKLDISELKLAIKNNCKKVVFLKGDGTDRLKEDFPDVLVFNSMAQAFQEILKSTASGDILLLSPAFTSFSLYQNEYERSDEFKKLVFNYKKDQVK